MDHLCVSLMHRVLKLRWFTGGNSTLPLGCSCTFPYPSTGYHWRWDVPRGKSDLIKPFHMVEALLKWGWPTDVYLVKPNKSWSLSHVSTWVLLTFSSESEALLTGLNPQLDSVIGVFNAICNYTVLVVYPYAPFCLHFLSLKTLDLSDKIRKYLLSRC